jgi:cyclic AMP-dependent transcription factor ATF-6 alpha
MDNPGGFPLVATGADGGEVELESLGLGLFDPELAECFENCPEWNDPLLDTSVLDELRDCLSDDLWSSPDLQLLTEGGIGTQNDDQPPPVQPPPPPPGPSFMATPPYSPQGSESALSPTPSVASSTLTSSSDAPTPQKVPSPWSEAGMAQSGVSPLQSSVFGIEQPVVWNIGPETNNPTAVQVLKSGEVVQMMANPNLQLEAQLPQATGSMYNVNPPQAGQALPGATGSPPPVQPPKKTAAASRKRQHPESGTTADAMAAGGADMSQLSKKQQRLIKNREAASASRQKKKEYVQTLEGRLREAALKNTALLQENDSLRKQLVQLEAENKMLRVSLSQPGSNSLSVLQKPALVMVVCVCFISLLFLPKYTDFSVGPSTTALSVTQSSHVPGRALLEYRDPSSSGPSLGRSSRQQQSLPVSQLAQRARSSSSSNALVPVSGEGSHLEALDRKVQELRRLYEAIPCPPRQVSSSVCSCPAAQNKTSNSTALQLLSEEMTECFKWYEEHHPRWLHPNQDTTPENSLAIVVNTNSAQNGGEYQVTELRDMPLLYKSFKKYFTRKLDNFYLISFKDHLLLNAPLHNSTEHPVLSVIIPTQGFILTGHAPHDCQILSTDIIHLPRASV